jgi:hypothetical protein
LQPYNLTYHNPVFTICRFHPSLATIPKPAKRARARLYCSRCRRYHHLAWGEMVHAITRNHVQTLAEIVDSYADKYCYHS